MKKMLMGIFLLVLSVWCLIFGVVDDIAFFAALGVILPFPAIILTFYGFFHKE